MTQPAIRTRVWRSGILERENFPFEEVSDYLEQPDTLVWADIICPDHDTICQLAEELNLDEHAVEDALDQQGRPKATRFPTHLFLTTNAIQLDAATGAVRSGRVSAFTTKQAFVTVRLDDVLDLDSVLARWDDNADLTKHGPKALIHGLLDEIVDVYFEVVGALDDSVEDIEDILFDDNPKMNREVSQRTYVLRRALVDVRRAILPMREVVNTIARRVAADERELELIPYFEDLYDHILRATEWTESLRDMVTSIFETNMALSDNRMNMVMKKLTAWAAIIAVPTAVTGYFGQNVPYPGFGREWGFVTSLFVIVVIAGALYASFRRRDWL